MPDDDVLNADVFEHVVRDLAGESALVFPVHVLGPESKLSSAQYPANPIKGRKRRADNDIGSARFAETLFEVLREAFGLRGCLVHFPVAGNEFGSHRPSGWGGEASCQFISTAGLRGQSG